MSILSDRNNITGEAEKLLLKELLEKSKKNRIKSIAERYGVKVTDKNTKQQMIEALLPAMEAGFGIRLKQYSDDQLRLAMDCFTENGTDAETAARIADSEPFRDGAVFVIAVKDRYFTAVPHELAGKLMMRCVSQCLAANGSELDRCAAACAVIYGTFTPKMLADAANSAYALSLTEKEAERYLASKQSDLFHYSDGMAVGMACAENPVVVRPEASELDYYLPTRTEVEAYAAFGADSVNYYYRQTVNFIYNNTGISYDEAKHLIRTISDWCLSDGDIHEIFEVIGKTNLVLNADKFNYLLSMISELGCRTHKPCLKGHKPEDMDGFQPPVIPGVQVSSPKAAPVRVGQKVGRNDPCPCGSGKKYKKCCGRNQ